SQLPPTWNPPPPSRHATGCRSSALPAPLRATRRHATRRALGQKPRPPPTRTSAAAQHELQLDTASDASRLSGEPTVISCGVEVKSCSVCSSYMHRRLV